MYSACLVGFEFVAASAEREARAEENTYTALTKAEDDVAAAKYGLCVRVCSLLQKSRSVHVTCLVHVHLTW